MKVKVSHGVMIQELSFCNSNVIIDFILKFIALEAGLSVSTTQCILRQVFRLFFHSWIGQGCPVRVVRSSKQFWYNVEGYEPRGELIQLVKYLRALFKLVAGLIFGRKVLCVGARDKRWVADYYGREAARIDFAGSPDWLVRRNDNLRGRLVEFLKSNLLAPDAANAVAIAMPEDLLEGTLFRLRLFLKLVPRDKSKQICSEDLIENSSSACLVVIALERQWQFIYKEHAVPMFVFKDHFSWEYLGLASAVLIAEDYAEHICDDELRAKCFYSKRIRKCRFEHDPKGKVLVCLPFISDKAWLAGDQWTRDMGFDESDLPEISKLIEALSANEEIEVRHHPRKSKGISVKHLPRETYGGGGVKEVLFVGWTQGLFECLDAGVPARVLLPRPMVGLNKTGQKYFSSLQDRGLVQWLNVPKSR